MSQYAKDVQERSTLCLSHETALLYWRAVREGRLPAPQRLDDKRLPKETISGLRKLRDVDLSCLGVTMCAEGLLALYTRGPAHEPSSRRHAPELASDPSLPSLANAPLGLAIPPSTPRAIHVAVGEMRSRHLYFAIQAHLLSGTLPAGSLYRVSDDIMVVSPEWAFVQSCLPDRDLPNIELALELCGSYTLGAQGMPCTFGVPPLTTHDKLADFLTQVRRQRGCAAARRALAWTEEGMASPREVETYLLLVLSPSDGGFGLERPLVNVDIPLEGTPAQALTSASHFQVDLLWPKKRVVLEHDGIAEHEASAAAIAADKERRSVLAALGYTVIVLTRRDFASVSAFRKKITQLAMALGTELPDFSPREAEAHASLFRWLSNFLHEHLPLGYGYH